MLVAALAVAEETRNITIIWYLAACDGSAPAIICPVTRSASTSQRTVRAIASGLPGRPMGTAAASAANDSAV